MFAKLTKNDGWDVAWDDVSGVKLDADMVKNARRVKMDFFDRMHVYDRVPREHQQQNGGTWAFTSWLTGTRLSYN